MQQNWVTDWNSIQFTNRKSALPLLGSCILYGWLAFNQSVFCAGPKRGSGRRWGMWTKELSQLRFAGCFCALNKWQSIWTKAQITQHQTCSTLIEVNSISGSIWASLISLEIKRNPSVLNTRLLSNPWSIYREREIKGPLNRAKLL